MKGKKFAEVFASLVKTVAIASVSESSDWYNYQTKEPEGLRRFKNLAVQPMRRWMFSI